ncbi:MAG: SAM-dependent DNA methyltransferase [Rickettsiales bacterium]|nr:SAM-dependent DNA methyltransferase [Rickettsiales bacterium]
MEKEDAIDEKFTQAQLEQHLWRAADILRGSIDSSDYKHYIFGLLFFKRLSDVWQEEYEQAYATFKDEELAADPDEHRFAIPEGAFWDDLAKQSTNIGEHLNNAFHKIEDANLRLKDIFQDIDFNNKQRFPDSILQKLIQHFDKYRLRNSDVSADMLGNSYEYLIKKFADDSGKKGGEFYTPEYVVKLMVKMLAPKEGMSVYDPTCGSGGMLIQSYHALQEAGLNPKTLSLAGQEKNLNTWAICKMNMFLHDIDDAVIDRGDTLRNPRNLVSESSKGLKQFDRVIANPPFSLKEWGYDIWDKGDPYGRDIYGCPPKSYGDLAFVQHMIASLKDDGRMAVVLPHGVLFRGGAEGRIREGLLNQDLIEAVIGIAPNLFYGAGIPACILLINKNKPADKTGKVMIINGAEEYKEGKAQNTLTEENVARFVSTYESWQDVERFARLVLISEITTNDHNLNIARYVHTAEEEEPIDVKAELSSLKDLIAKRDEAENVMMKHLQGLGYDS